MKFNRLNIANGSWDALCTEWKNSCDTYDEDYEEIIEPPLSHLKAECDSDETVSSSGVFALQDDNGSHHAVCFANSTLLKGYDGQVLRVRRMTLSPYYQFENLTIESYAEILGDFFNGTLELSSTHLPSKHIKINYGSPNDRMLYTAFALASDSRTSISIESKGMWLHVTKS